MVLGNHPNSPNDHIVPVTRLVGVEFVTEALSNPTSIFSKDPVYNGVTTISVKGGGALDATGTPFATAANEQLQISAAAGNHGMGRVVIVGDFDLWRDPEIAWSDNLVFAKNVFEWIGGGDQ